MNKKTEEKLQKMDEDFEAELKRIESGDWDPIEEQNKKWEKIISGEMKKPFIFADSEFALLGAAISNLLIPFVDVLFGYYAIVSANASSKNKYEQTNKYVIFAKVAKILGIVGIVRAFHSYYLILLEVGALEYIKNLL